MNKLKHRAAARNDSVVDPGGLRLGSLLIGVLVVATVAADQPRIKPPSIHVPGGTIHGADPLTLGRWTEPLLRRDLVVNSSQSCSSTACHGGPRSSVVQPRAVRGAAHQLWFENDPHARSWRTFCSDRSVRMMRRLKILDAENNVLDTRGYDNCLACHNTTGRYHDQRSGADLSSKLAGSPLTTLPLTRWSLTKSPLTRSSLNAESRFASSEPVSRGDVSHDTADATLAGSATGMGAFVREGVGCAGCHGPSERWIGTHTQRDWNPASQSGNGFIDNGDLYIRARMCMTCHVGDHDRDMNHDIIAAGHPPLRFEMATHQAWQPKHWRDTEQANPRRFEAQLWVAGQIAASDASLALLQTRATRSLHVSRWPELSSHDCFSCHQNVRIDPQVGDLGIDEHGLSRGLSGVAVYSRWNDSGLRWFLKQRQRTGQMSSQGNDVRVHLQRVRDIMESSPTPDPSFVVAAATDARRSIATWVEQQRPGWELTFDGGDLSELVAGVAGDLETFETWESAVQFYLAAIAARTAWPGGIRGPATDPANRFRQSLAHRGGQDSSGYNAPRSAITMPTTARDRDSARRAGIELARWLGPIGNVDDDPNGSKPRSLELEIQQLRRRLSAATRELQLRNEQLQKDSENRPVPKDPPPIQPPMVLPPPKPKPPAKPRMSREEAREEVREAIRRRLSEPLSDDPSDPSDQ